METTSSRLALRSRTPRGRILLAAFLCALLAGARPAAAQDAPGKSAPRTVWHTLREGYPEAADGDPLNGEILGSLGRDAPPYRAHLDSILQVLKRNPALRASGLDLYASVMGGESQVRGVPHMVELQISWFKPGETHAPEDGIVVTLNSVEHLLAGNDPSDESRWEDAKDNRQHFGWDPGMVQESGRWVARQHGNEVVLTRRPGPIFVPVTVDFLFRTAIADETAQMPAGAKDRVEKLWRSMSPAELARQAHHCRGYFPWDLCNEKGAHPVVRTNPQLFDRTLPRTAIQVMTVERLWSARMNPSREYPEVARAFDAAVQQIDWAAMERMLSAGSTAPATPERVPSAPPPAPAPGATSWNVSFGEDAVQSRTVRGQFQQMTRPILELLKALPSIKALQGRIVNVGLGPLESRAGEPIRGTFGLAFFRSQRWLQEGKSDAGYGMSINILSDLWPSDAPLQYGFHVGPPLSGKTFKGFPNSSGHGQILTRRAAPLALPVTAEEFLRARIARLAGRLQDEAERYDWERYRQEKQDVERALARMSTAQRAEKAFFCGNPDLVTLLCPSSSGEQFQLFRENPDFFDRSRPPTDIQILIIRRWEANTDADGLNAPVRAAYRDELDWQALYGLVR